MPSRAIKHCTICQNHWAGPQAYRLARKHTIDKCLAECYRQMERASRRLVAAVKRAEELGYDGPSYR